MQNLERETGGERQKDRSLIGCAISSLAPAVKWTIHSVGEGFRARVYRVDWFGPGGEAGHWAARVSEEGDDLLREHTVCRDVLPALGVPAPQILGFFEQAGLYCSVRGFVEGVPPWEAKRPNFGRALELMAAFHQYDVETAPSGWKELYTNYDAGYLQSAFTELPGVLALARRSQPGFGWLPPSFHQLADTLAAKSGAVIRQIQQARRSCVHGDAVPGNFLFGPSGESPILVDWDRFGVYVPHVDVLSALYHHSDEERRPLIAGYLDACRRLSGVQSDETDFYRVMDLVDLQRSAEIVGFWLGRVLERKVDPARVTGFLQRRVRAIETVSDRLGLTQMQSGRSHS